jgi:hypothetical protein
MSQQHQIDGRISPPARGQNSGLWLEFRCPPSDETIYISAMETWGRVNIEDWRTGAGRELGDQKVVLYSLQSLETGIKMASMRISPKQHKGIITGLDAVARKRSFILGKTQGAGRAAIFLSVIVMECIY